MCVLDVGSCVVLSCAPIKNVSNLLVSDFPVLDVLYFGGTCFRFLFFIFFLLAEGDTRVIPYDLQDHCLSLALYM